MNPVHIVTASSFADPEDVAAFQRAKRLGMSDQEAFKVGDNGIGAWGHRCAQDEIPMVALPREAWRGADKRGGAKVLLTFGDKSIIAILGDTMPALAHITNGAGIDLNPAASKALGLKPPFMQKDVQWSWA